MLLLLLSDDSMASDWVHRELRAYLERPRKEWRIAPVFLDTRHPRDLPPRFRVLGDFHGGELPMAPENAAESKAMANSFSISLPTFARRAGHRQRSMVAAVALLFFAVIGSLIWRNQHRAQVDALLKGADLEKAASRFDLAEEDLARVWELERTRTALDSYREVRSRRIFENPTLLKVHPEEEVIALDESNGEPYAIVHSNDDASPGSQGTETGSEIAVAMQ